MEEFPPHQDKGEGEDDASLRGRVATAVRRASREQSPEIKAHLVEAALARKAEEDGKQENADKQEARRAEQRREVKDVAYTNRRYALAILKHLKPTGSDYDDVHKVAGRLGQLEAAAGNAENKPAELMRQFAEWTQNAGFQAWGRFKELRERLLELEAQERKLAEAEKLKADEAVCRQAAMSAAIQLRDANPHGPNLNVGTVCAGLAHISKEVWRGTSGGPLEDLHPVMATLLSGVVQVEKWPVGACGEVHAMNQYLTAHGIGSVSEIEGAKLFSHAETWNETQGKWQGRAACKNCEQWMDKVKINRA